MDENSKYINEFYQKNKGEIIANKSKSETQNNSGKNLGKIGQEKNNKKELAVMNSGTQMLKEYIDANSQKLKVDFRTAERYNGSTKRQ